MPNPYYRSKFNSKDFKSNLFWSSADTRTVMTGKSYLWVNQRADVSDKLPLLHGWVDIPLDVIAFAKEYQRWRQGKEWQTKMMMPTLRFDLALWEVDPALFKGGRHDNPPFYRGKVKYMWQDIENPALKAALDKYTNYSLEKQKERWEIWRHL